MARRVIKYKMCFEICNFTKFFVVFIFCFRMLQSIHQIKQPITMAETLLYTLIRLYNYYQYDNVLSSFMKYYVSVVQIILNLLV